MNTPQPVPSHVPPQPYSPKEDWLYKLLGPEGKKKLLHQHRVRPRQHA